MKSEFLHRTGAIFYRTGAFFLSHRCVFFIAPVRSVRFFVAPVRSVRFFIAPVRFPTSHRCGANFHSTPVGGKIAGKPEG